jgi:hypothetical protein
MACAGAYSLFSPMASVGRAQGRQVLKVRQDRDIQILDPATMVGGEIEVQFAVLARLVRASMLEVMGENYIRAARSFGLVLVILFFISAIFAPLIAPYDPFQMDITHNLPNENHWCLSRVKCRVW